MADAEAVVFAFGAQAERRKTAESADRFELGAAPSEDFVWVSLMADIPDDAVVRRVETHMQRQRQLDGAEIGGEVTRSEEHTSELQSLMRISDAVFCLKKKK